MEFLTGIFVGVYSLRKSPIAQPAYFLLGRYYLKSKKKKYAKMEPAY